MKRLGFKDDIDSVVYPVSPELIHKERVICIHSDASSQYKQKATEEEKFVYHYIINKLNEMVK